jgi:hypothetical protein
VAGLTFVGWQQPIGCGGVAVFPNDVIVVDGDGAVLIPQALVDEVVDAAVEQERLEGWIMREVEAGAPLPGLYPPDGRSSGRSMCTVVRCPQPAANACTDASGPAKPANCPWVLAARPSRV